MKMIHRVDIEQIPFENLRALFEYVDHGAWPNLGKLPRNALKQRRSPKVVTRGDKGKSSGITDLRQKSVSSTEATVRDKVGVEEQTDVPAIIKL